jgi:cell division protein FtsW
MGGTRLKRFRTGFVPGLGLLLAVVGLIISEDLGTAVLIVGAGMLLLVAAGVRIWHVAILAPIPVALMVLAIVVSPYRIQRIRAFLDPYADPQGQGYHMIQSMVAVSAGEFTGRGLGHGVHKFGYLPEDTNDFLFAIICEELGLFGAVFVLFLYGILIHAIFSILKRLGNPTARLIALGIMMTISFQALINLLVVTGLAPTKGIALPLLSAGGTGWVLTAFSLGLVIGMDRFHGDQSSIDVASAAAADDGPYGAKRQRDHQNPMGPVISISPTSRLPQRGTTIS